MLDIKLYKGDCLEVMDKLIEQGVKVDAIITDPPYGTTACKWDSVIPFEPMWEKINKLTNSNTPILLFGSQPFTSALIMSNVKNFKYEIVWDKVGISNPMLAKKQVLKSHENIVVFYKSQPVYNPQMTIGTKWKRGGKSNKKIEALDIEMDRTDAHKSDTTDLKYPKSIFTFSNADNTKRVHPTQKPVALLEYLIKTYTNEGDTVLDFTTGSGSTGVACVNTNRNFIGIELDENYFKIAEKRIEEAKL